MISTNDFFELISISNFAKTMENVRKHVRKNVPTNNNRKKKLYSVRIKLSCCKVLYRKFLGYRNDKYSNTHEEPCLFSLISISSE